MQKPSKVRAVKGISTKLKHSVQKRKSKPVIWYALGFFSAILLLFGATLWMAGSVYSEMPQRARLNKSYEPVDVIVCLTGGRGRIRRAFELYEQGFGKLLYISGIDPQASVPELLKEQGWLGPFDPNRIILENISTNTVQNAEQVRAFLNEKQLKSMMLVTSSYHAKRAHYIFRKILPHDVRLDMAWFEREPFDESDWWKEWNGIWVTVSEFFKFFYAYVRLR